MTFVKSIARKSLLALIACAILAFSHQPALADPADIDAAARGVVRVVVVGRDGEEIFPISHGTGFAVDGETIVTNAHVVGEALQDTRLSIGIVPSDGGDAVFGRVVSVSPRNDLALLTTTTPMRLPPLTIAGNPPSGFGSVTAVGYPMNVDQAQGLDAEDIFKAQPPVTSNGSLSGRRPSREFDTLLHTAPIARGNSGGPLVDDCGRVVGVNSFGAESEGTEAEFFFAVTTRELLPFLRANGITPQINALPCRSMQALDADEREREARRLLNAQMQQEAEEQALAQRRDELRRQIEYAVFDERTNGNFISLLGLIIALAAGAYAYEAHRKKDFRPRAIAGSIAAIAIIGAIVALITRPSFTQVNDRLEDQLRADMEAQDIGIIEQPGTVGLLACVLDTSRSRVLGAPVQDITIEWDENGCANARTQYGLTDGAWMRVLVPANEEAVSVNRYSPQSGEYEVDRYLLDREAMTAARAARGQYEAPQCGTGQDAAMILGSQQTQIITQLPSTPNERLVYNCSVQVPEDEPVS